MQGLFGYASMPTMSNKAAFNHVYEAIMSGRLNSRNVGNWALDVNAAGALEALPKLIDMLKEERVKYRKAADEYERATGRVHPYKKSDAQLGGMKPLSDEVVISWAKVVLKILETVENTKDAKRGAGRDDPATTGPSPSPSSRVSSDAPGTASTSVTPRTRRAVSGSDLDPPMSTKDDVASLQNIITGLHEKIAKLERENAGLKDDLVTLSKGEGTGQTEKIANMERRLSENEDEIARLQKELQTAQEEASQGLDEQIELFNEFENAFLNQCGSKNYGKDEFMRTVGEYKNICIRLKGFFDAFGVDCGELFGESLEIMETLIDADTFDKKEFCDLMKTDFETARALIKEAMSSKKNVFEAKGNENEGKWNTALEHATSAQNAEEERRAEAARIAAAEQQRKQEAEARAKAEEEAARKKAAEDALRVAEEAEARAIAEAAKRGPAPGASEEQGSAAATAGPPPKPAALREQAAVATTTPGAQESADRPEVIPEYPEGGTLEQKKAFINFVVNHVEESSYVSDPSIRKEIIKSIENIENIRANARFDGIDEDVEVQFEQKIKVLKQNWGVLGEVKKLTDATKEIVAEMRGGGKVGMRGGKLTSWEEAYNAIKPIYDSALRLRIEIEELNNNDITRSYNEAFEFIKKVYDTIYHFFSENKEFNAAEKSRAIKMIEGAAEQLGKIIVAIRASKPQGSQGGKSGGSSNSDRQKYLKYKAKYMKLRAMA